MTEQEDEFPQELVPLRAHVEEYVIKRMRMMGKTVAQKFAPDVTAEQIEEVVQELSVVPEKPTPPPTPMGIDLMLAFRHDCNALGCRDSECTLCQYNPVRLCERNFSKKYLVGDILKAKCGATIKVEVLTQDGQVYTSELPGLHFEVNLIDGVAYKDKGGENRLLSDDELKVCFKLTNHREEALLQHKATGSNTSKKVIIKTEKGEGQLPDLQVTDSSEALLTGRRPPFRLLIWAVGESGELHPNIKYAVSDEFVVATRRVKQANKADIPLVDDHVSKIEHIGRETVKKLLDLPAAAVEVGMNVDIPNKLRSISTVGHFQMLVSLADTDAQLRKMLQIVLKLSKEKWEEAAHHAMQAVVPDFRKRVWYPPGHNMGIGLLFHCKYGAVQLRDNVALVQATSNNGYKVIPEDQLDPASLTIMRQLKAQAVSAWWSPRHPGWGIFRDSIDGLDARAFEATATPFRAVGSAEYNNLCLTGNPPGQRPLQTLTVGPPPTGYAAMPGAIQTARMGDELGYGTPLRPDAVSPAPQMVILKSAPVSGVHPPPSPPPTVPKEEPGYVRAYPSQQLPMVLSHAGPSQPQVVQAGPVYVEDADREYERERESKRARLETMRDPKYSSQEGRYVEEGRSPPNLYGQALQNYYQQKRAQDLAESTSLTPTKEQKPSSPIGQEGSAASPYKEARGGQEADGDPQEQTEGEGVVKMKQAEDEDGEDRDSRQTQPKEASGRSSPRSVKTPQEVPAHQSTPTVVYYVPYHQSQPGQTMAALPSGMQGSMIVLPSSGQFATPGPQVVSHLPTSISGLGNVLCLPQGWRPTVEEVGAQRTPK